MIENEKYKDLTPQQQQVIAHKNGNLLVSASAGSGKTKVLVTKILDLILNKQAKLKQLLVVTFTNDASLEMKIRLSDELQNSNDTFLQEQVDDLSTSDILTFDKFCIKIVREFGYKIGMTDNFGVADDSLSKFLQSKALEIIFTKHNKNLDIKYESLMEQFFGKRNFSSLKNSVVKVYNFLRTKSIDQDYYAKLLENSYSQDFANNFVISFLNNELLNKTETFCQKLKEMLLQAQQLQSKLLSDSILDCIGKVGCINENFENNYEIIRNGLNFSKLTRQELSAEEDEIKSQLSSLKKEYSEYIKKIVPDKSKTLAQIKEDVGNTKQNLKVLFDLVSEFDKEYKKQKNYYQVLDFCDVELYAGKILQDPDIANAIKNRYKYIFIDEYQDTNEIQDQIIRDITTGENLIMVGDVKQSIYRFRQAEPKIFLNKYNLYKDCQTTNKLVELNKNFRSESDILNFANFVFDGIMQKDCSGIDYKSTSRLEFGETMKKSCEHEQIKIFVVNDNSEESDEAEQDENKISSCYSVKDDKLQFGEYTKIQKEAQIVASEISQMIGKNYYDAKTKSFKTIDFGDIAILSRRKSGVAILVSDVLKKAGIPVNCTYRCNLYESYDIQMLINILKVVENKHNDVALISTLCMASNGLTFTELSKIRNTYKSEKYFYGAVENYLKDNEDEISLKIEKCYKKLKNYRLKSCNCNLDELILDIVQNEQLEMYFAINGYGQEFENHLRLLLDSINSIKNYSLAEFINYVDTFAEEMSFDVNVKDSDNSVQINTIHSSKGLEYPVVFLIDTGSKFNNQSIKDRILVENEFGISTKSLDIENHCLYDSPINLSFKKKIVQEEKMEQMRLLYVALTRPKNFLTVVGTTNIEKITEVKCAQDVLGCDNYLSWILGLFTSSELAQLSKDKIIHKSCCNAEVQINMLDQQQLQCNNKEASKNQPKIQSNFNNNFEKVLDRQFVENNLVKKNSVSQILSDEQHYNISDFTAKVTDREGDEDFALIGTVYHKIMQLLDIKNPSLDVKKQIEQFVIDGTLSKEELDIVDIDKIDIACKKIANQIGADDVVLKEQQFVCFFPANQLINTSSVDKILVQGVADLIIIKNDEICLIDYKTSRIKTDEKFIQKYKTQLDIYAKAIEEYYEKKVTKKVIYSFYLDKAIII